MKEHEHRHWWSRLWHRLFRHCGSGSCSGCGGCGRGCGSCEQERASGRPHHRPIGGELCTLAHLCVGQSGRVIEVADGDQDLVNRFADHGLVRGITVTVHEQALFGGPMLVAVQGTMVALRLREADLIRVEACDPADRAHSLDEDISWKQRPHQADGDEASSAADVPEAEKPESPAQPPSLPPASPTPAAPSAACSEAPSETTDSTKDPRSDGEGDAPGGQG